MKKQFIVASLLISFIFTLSACGPKTSQDIMSKELGLSISGGKEILNYDTYSNGEGISCIALSFNNDTVLNEIKENPEWKSFSLDDTVHTLVYGSEDEKSKVGPFVSDAEGKPIIPTIKNGYYLLIDRHAETEINILDRGSFNFTIGLYDVASNTLYFCKLDTWAYKGINN